MGGSILRALLIRSALQIIFARLSAIRGDVEVLGWSNAAPSETTANRVSSVNQTAIQLLRVVSATLQVHYRTESCSNSSHISP